MDLSFVEPKTLFLIGHLLGIALGVGGAFMSDILFFKSIRDGKISKTEMSFLELGSLCVTFGLIVLIISGIGLFSLDTERYLNSSKFLVKMTIVAILSVNGIIFHMLHIPLLKKWVAGSISAAAVSKRRWHIMASGVISLVSWISALVLGAFRSIPFSYEIIFYLYLAVLAGGLFVGFVLMDKIIPRFKNRRS